MKNHTFSLPVIVVSLFMAGCNRADVEQGTDRYPTHSSAETQAVSSFNESDPKPNPSSRQMDEQAIFLLRSQYETEVRELKKVYENMLAEGSDLETIARALSRMRRDLGIKYREMTPADIVEKIYERNLERYGDKDGPTIPFLRDQGKSWEEIIESAMTPGGKDLDILK